MTGERGMRASDRERELTAEMLRDAYAAGRLDLGEFAERTDAAYSARTWGELRDLTADLPPGHVHAPAGLDLNPSREAAERYRAPRARPFAPLWAAAAVLLAVAAVAHLAAAVIPLVVLALFAHRVAR